MQKFLFFYCIFFLADFSVLEVNAQFTVNGNTICVGHPVVITDISPGTDPPYYNFNVPGSSEVCSEDGRSFGSGPFMGWVSCNTYTYNQPGTYNIRQWKGTVVTDPYSIQVVETRLPKFSIKKCENYRIIVVIEDNFYDEYHITFASGTTVVTGPNGTADFSYADANPKNIEIKGLFQPANCGMSANITVRPYANLETPELLSVITTDQSGSGRIELNSKLPSSEIEYVVESDPGNGIFTPLDTIRNSSGDFRYMLNNINSTTNQCFRISAINYCSSLPSQIICNIILNVTAANNQNNLSWPAYSGSSLAHYVVYKNNSVVTTTNSLSYTDTDVQCGRNYCYQIRAELSSRDLNNTVNLYSLSDEICVTGISTNIPDAIPDFRATIENEKVKLNWDQSFVKALEYTVEKSVSGGPFNSFGKYSAGPVFDNLPAPGINSCYRISYIDSCANKSPLSQTTCPMVLSINESETANGLNWTQYEGFVVQSYVVVKTDLNGNLIKQVDNGTSINYIDTEIDPYSSTGYIYYIVAISGSGLQSTSNAITVRYEIQIHVPTAFTPDNDGLNDIFFAKGKFFKDFKLTVYNRWGESVFYAEDINTGWDGTYLGNPCPSDSYAFVIEAKDLNGKEKLVKGTVTILK
ncbi:MAG: gliding motility-associated C-terminal domain-containing protein [Cytophagaceae bacterium]